jgi:hypothetical protein
MISFWILLPVPSAMVAGSCWVSSAARLAGPSLAATIFWKSRSRFTQKSTVAGEAGEDVGFFRKKKSVSK